MQCKYVAKNEITNYGATVFVCIFVFFNVAQYSVGIIVRYCSPNCKVREVYMLQV